MSDDSLSPLCRFNVSELQPKTIPLEDTNEFLRHSLQKGKYNIDYVISLLKIIEEECKRHQLNRHDLPLSLRESCKRLRGSLEVEKNCKTSKDPRVLVTCIECKQSVVIPKRIALHWKCPCKIDYPKKLEVLD